MLRQRHEAKLEWPIRTTFAALIGVLARGRWAGSERLEAAAALPRAGLRYEQQRPTALRRGRVVECIPPVSITLAETLLDAPCCVRLRLRWRLEPMEFVSFLRLDASFDLRGAAALRRRHWNERIDGHCTRTIAALEAVLAARAQEEDKGTSGQSQGRSAIKTAKVSSVSGRPTFR
ncbi:MAG TPA: hypothetical protein VFY39_16625 [Gammaproteobacteria bacterium]|nr:hypothetical protein [Gammaproteobacteria bacterium]